MLNLNKEALHRIENEQVWVATPRRVRRVLALHDIRPHVELGQPFTAEDIFHAAVAWIAPSPFARICEHYESLAFG